MFTSLYLSCSIKNDDKMIQAEGVESLSEYELRQHVVSVGTLVCCQQRRCANRFVQCYFYLDIGLFFGYQVRHLTPMSDSNCYLPCPKVTCQVGHPVQVEFQCPCLLVSK